MLFRLGILIAALAIWADAQNVAIDHFEKAVKIRSMIENFE